MMAFYKAAFTGKGADGTTLPITLTVNPMMAAMNSVGYDAMTLGNHEFNSAPPSLSARWARRPSRCCRQPV